MNIFQIYHTMKIMRPENYIFFKNHLILGISILGIIQTTYSQESLEDFRFRIAECPTATMSVGENLNFCLSCVQNSKEECNNVCASISEDQNVCSRMCWRFAKYGTFSCKSNIA
ncbi:hypothetical protein EWB00_009462 [Schistosoma japonicum]|uniref:Uncharacterized protein n=1 Tax=Schistosoma japonicum TaxID=6182 RepID=A0A4Z2DRD4_SCHJA|nr:hypothetical protein EWB00_009462 [Schistosoma japonicum]